MNPVKEINEEDKPGHSSIETDSQKIIHRHLQNKDDIITDEDIRNIRVGITDAEVQAKVKEEFKDEEGKDIMPG